MNNSATNTPRTRTKSAAKLVKKRDVLPKNNQTRYAFAPILQQFRRHTKKNEARLWIPIETSLLVRYEFAALSPQTRYIFVAILLYCGANGLDEIPLDARFMSSVLIVDERMLKKSFDELLFKNLLVEKREREEKNTQTDRTDAPDGGAVCVDSENLFQTESENQAEEVVQKDFIADNRNGNGHLSKFTIEECLKYVEACQSKGEAIQSPKALANHLFKTGEADSFILATLYPEKAIAEEAKVYGDPIRFTNEPCSVCFGAKMADADGKGFRKCVHCKDERGKSTGLEPKGETNDE